jgi:hypothetical protein
VNLNAWTANQGVYFNTAVAHLHTPEQNLERSSPYNRITSQTGELGKFKNKQSRSILYIDNNESEGVLAGGNAAGGGGQDQ